MANPSQGALRKSNRAFILSPSPLFPSKAKSWSPEAHILPEVEERGSDPAQGFRHPPLLIGFRGTPRRGDGQGIECGTQQGLPRQPVHLHWKTDPRKQGNQNQGPSGAGDVRSLSRDSAFSGVTHVPSLPQNRTGPKASRTSSERPYSALLETQKDVSGTPDSKTSPNFQVGPRRNSLSQSHLPVRVTIHPVLCQAPFLRLTFLQRVSKTSFQFHSPSPSPVKPYRVTREKFQDLCPQCTVCSPPQPSHGLSPLS